jgi:hypothetical protein
MITCSASRIIGCFSVVVMLESVDPPTDSHPAVRACVPTPVLSVLPERSEGSCMRALASESDRTASRNDQDSSSKEQVCLKPSVHTKGPTSYPRCPAMHAQCIGLASSYRRWSSAYQLGDAFGYRPGDVPKAERVDRLAGEVRLVSFSLLLSLSFRPLPRGSLRLWLALRLYRTLCVKLRIDSISRR